MVSKSIVETTLSSLYGKFEFSPASSTTISFLVISGREGPKWIIPSNSSYGLTALKQWRPYSVKAYLKWQLILTAYQLGLLPYLPNIETINFFAKEQLSLLSLQNDVPIIYIGTKNSTQKAVVQLVRKDETSPYAVFKVPLGNMAEQQIKQENMVLSLLPPAVQAFSPSLIDSTRGLQSWMAGAASSRVLSSQHIDVLLKLKNKELVTFSSFIDLLNIDLKGLPDGSNTSLPLASDLLEHLALLDRTLEFTSVWMHGDFAPWNIKVNKQLVLIDWEDADANGLPLQDLLHFVLIQGYLFGKKLDCLDAFFDNQHVIRYLRNLNLSSTHAQNLTQYYLMWACTQQLQANNLDHATYLHSLLLAAKDL